MNSICGVLFICCLIGCSWASPQPTWGEAKLMQAMRSTSELQQSNPSRSLQCFQYYNNVFDQLLKQYQLEYDNCQNTSKAQAAEMDSKFKPIVISLSDSAATSCQVLVDCNKQANSLLGLSCLTTQAGGNVRSMYNISSTASEYYGELEQNIQMIQFTENQCTNSSQRTYELKTDQAYINLQNCLMGLEPVPTMSPLTSTTAEATGTTILDTTTTTNAPTDSTQTSTVTSTDTSAYTTIASTTASSRRTRRPKSTTTPSILFTTNSATTQNSLTKWLNSLRH